MPRFRRVIRPGDLVHVISRFVNQEFRLSCPEERAELLSRLGKRVADSDWKLLSFAAMSSHLHTSYIVGVEPFENLIKSVHSPFAYWLNRRQGRLGPVFAGRPSTIIVDPVWTGRLVAYQHNNPPRAGLVQNAVESDWTSHRAYVGRAPRPQWLSVSLGFELMGLRDDEAGRAAFDSCVLQRQWEPRDMRLTGNIVRESRELRSRLQASVSLQHPRSGPEGLDYSPQVLASRWDGKLNVIVELVASQLGVSPLSISSTRRDREVVAARRQVALVGAALGQTNQRLGLILGISEAGVRKLRKAARADEREIAARILADLQRLAS